MAATPLVATSITRDGNAGALSAANADGHTIVRTDKLLLEVANGGGAPMTVTISMKPVDGQAVSRVVTVPNGARRLMGDFPDALFPKTLTVAFSSVSSVTVGAFVI